MIWLRLKSCSCLKNGKLIFFSKETSIPRYMNQEHISHRSHFSQLLCGDYGFYDTDLLDISFYCGKMLLQNPTGVFFLVFSPVCL